MKSLFVILSFILMCNLPIPAHGQDLSKHLWKNRLLLVLSDDTLAPDFLKQMESLRSDPDGLEERKLVVYKVTASEYQEGINAREWIPSPELYKSYHKAGNTLEVVLIGLDGSVKHRADSLVPPSQIFSWIDAMPMRRQELRNR